MVLFEDERIDGNHGLKPWQVSLNQFFSSVWVEVVIGVLVIVSVLLTLVEFWLESELTGVTSVQSWVGELSQSHLDWIMMINELITVLFVVELSCRFACASSKRAFFGEFWLDIIATMPMFRIFRSARALRLLRLVRLLRLLGIFARLSQRYPSLFKNSAVDFIMICGILVIAVGFGTLSITHFEKDRRFEKAASMPAGVAPVATQPRASAEVDFNFEKSFWFSVYTLLAGEPVPGLPSSVSSKIVTVVLMFMGMTIFAIFAGTVSAFMVDRMRREGRIVEWDALSDHIVICGWTQKTPIIIREYRASKTARKIPIVVITEREPDTLVLDPKLGNVMFVHDDFTKVSALKRAGIERAKTCLVLTDISGGRSEQDADARTILTSLTVEKINESVYTCAELVNRNYASHLEAGNVNDFVVSGEYGAHMLAQAAMKRGLVNVVAELLTYEKGNEFYRLPIPASWIGTSFDDKLAEVRRTCSAILVAVHSPDDVPHINPPAYTFREHDQVVIISSEQPNLT